MNKTEQRVLQALQAADRPLHGYGIVRAIEAAPGGPKWVGIAPLYMALFRLLDKHMIARGGLMDVEGTGKVRQVYGITPYGRKALADSEPS